MPFQDEMDDLSSFESKETARKIPFGWALLFSIILSLVTSVFNALASDKPGRS